MSLSKVERAHVIIHSLALSAGLWSGAFATIPIAGPATFDSGGLLAITAIMAGLLSHHVFNRDLQGSITWGVFVAPLQFFLGAAILKACASLVPFFGNIVNGFISVGTVEVIGWTMYLILDAGKDPRMLSKDEMFSYLKQGKAQRDSYQRSGEFVWMEQLPPEAPPDEKKRNHELRQTLGDPALSDEERSAVFREMKELLERYR